MCLGIAGQIIDFPALAADLAVVDVMGARRAVNIGLLENENLRAGDWVLIHVGFAIAKMDEEEAKASLAFLGAMAQAHMDELAAAFDGESKERTDAKLREGDKKSGH